MAVRFAADGRDYTRTLSLGSQTQWSVCCWVKITDRNAISTVWSLDVNGGDFYFLQTKSDGTTLGLFSDEDSTTPIGDTASRALTAGIWYFVGVSVNGTNGTMTSRAAGDTAFTTVTWTSAAIPAPAASTTITTLRIGESPFGSEWLNGAVTGFKLWTGSGATLTAGELAAEAWTLTPKRTTNLRSWHPFTRAETADYSGNGNTLSGGSGTTTEDGPGVPWRHSRRTLRRQLGFGADVEPGPLVTPWSLPEPGISTGLTHTPGLIAATWTLPEPDVSILGGGPPTQVNPSRIVAPWSVPAPDVRVDVTVSPEPIIALWSIPTPETQGSTNPGDDLDGPGQLSLGGFKMGGGTPYGLVDELVGADIDLPSVDEGDVLNPSSDGAMSGRPLPQPRYITATFRIRAPRDQMREVMETFRQNTPLPDADEELDLALQVLDQIYVTRAKVIRRTAAIDKNYRLGLAKAVLQVKCVDPRLYSRELGSANISDGQTIEVTNLGNRRTRPLVRIPGPAPTPRLEVFRTLADAREDLRVLEFDLTVAEDEILVVDVANGTAEIGGETVENDLTGASIGLPDWVLGPGPSEISYESADGTAPDITVLWRHAWL